MKSAKLILADKTIELPIVIGTENEHGIDISKLRAQSGYITLDPGYGNTGSCKSSITFIDGEKGILRYRGIPIEQLTKDVRFTDVAHLLIWGDFPNKKRKVEYRQKLTECSYIHEDMRLAFTIVLALLCKLMLFHFLFVHFILHFL